MKTVWVIEQGTYSDYHVVGLFSTKENAELVASKLNPEGSDYQKPEISEWNIDPSIDQLNAGLSQWRVSMMRDGTLRFVEPEEDFTTDLDEKPVINGPWKLAAGYQPAMLFCDVWATDEQHAVKITNEHRTRLIAEGKWPA